MSGPRCGPRRRVGVHRRGPRGCLADAGGAAGLRRWRHLVRLPRRDAGHHPRRRRDDARDRARPRPTDVVILGDWQGYAFPSRPVGRDLPGARRRAVRPGAAGRRAHPGRPGSRPSWSLRSCLARLYLAVDHPTDVLAARRPRDGSATGRVPAAHARRRLPRHLPASGGAHLELSRRGATRSCRALDQQLGLASSPPSRSGSRALPGRRRCCCACGPPPATSCSCSASCTPSPTCGPTAGTS